MHPRTRTVIATLALATLLLAPAARATYQVELPAGWSLVSIPEHQPETDPTAVTASIAANLLSVWSWEDGVWRFYDPARPQLSDLRIMDAGRAYWVELAAPDTLVGHGWPASGSIQLEAGWNLVGLNDSAPRDVDGLLASTGSCVESIWGWDGATWHTWQRALRQLSDLTTLEPGHGYWVEASGPCDLSVSGTAAPELVSLGDVELAALLAVAECELVFDGSPGQLAGLAAGDIVAGGPTALAPGGFLRRVAATGLVGTELHVQTELATVGEAAPEMRSGATAMLEVAGLGLAEGQGTRLARPEEVPERVRRDLPGAITLVIDSEFQDVAPGVNVYLTGTYSFQPQFTVYALTSGGETQRFVAAFSGRAVSDVAATASVGADILNWQTTLGPDIPFQPIPIVVSGVPIGWVTPHVRVCVGIDGRLESTLASETEADVTATAGVMWQSASGWEAIHELEVDHTSAYPNPGVGGSLRLWAGPQVEFQLYDIAGPFAAMRAFTELTVDTQPPPVEVYLGAALTVGATTSYWLDAMGIHRDCEPVSFDVKLRVYPGDLGHIIGQTVDGDGNPLGGVEVGAIGNSGSWATTSETDGSFDLEVAASTFERVELSKLGYVPTVLWAVSVSSGEYRDLGPVRLVADGTVCAIAGTITDSTSGAPVGGLIVLARRGVDAVRGGVMAVATTEPTGAYQLLGLEPGVFTLEVLGGGYYSAHFTASCTGGSVSPANDHAVDPITLGSNEVTFTLPGGVPLVMVRIPAGTFWMGSPWTERSREVFEWLHQVTLSGDYYLGKYEVTQAQWEAVMGTPMSLDCGTYGVGPGYPVYCVSWTEITSAGGFLDRLNAHLGASEFRLPTEAEWERAARAGNQHRFSHGDVLECGDYCGACPAHDLHMWWCNYDGIRTTAAAIVGSRPPNDFGLFDMSGNVYEWSQDWFDSDLGTAPVVDPTGPTHGQWRSLRGGGWAVWVMACRSAAREADEPDARNYKLGFRVARTAE